MGRRSGHFPRRSGWERSHLHRAVASFIALVLLAIAVVTWAEYFQLCSCLRPESEAMPLTRGGVDEAMHIRVVTAPRKVLVIGNDRPEDLL